MSAAPKANPPIRTLLGPGPSPVHPRVLEALGHEARPPFPTGYVLEPFDAALLDPVRARPKRYREC